MVYEVVERQKRHKSEIRCRSTLCKHEGNLLWYFIIIIIITIDIVVEVSKYDMVGSCDDSWENSLISGTYIHV